MRKIMSEWIEKNQEKYGIKIISYDWYRCNNRLQIQLSSETRFGKLPGEPMRDGEANGYIFYKLIFDGIEYTWLTPMEEEQENE